MSTLTLWPYQLRAKEWILSHSSAALFIEMGLGKTVVALTALQELIYDRFEVGRTLVIAPKKVAESVWTSEVEKWPHLRNMTVARVLGSEKQRLEALKVKADVYVINRENVQWLVEWYKEKWPFDTVVIDELSSFKNPTSQRFKALRKVRGLIRRVIGLTGTPSPNGYMDLWPQLYLLDRGERLGRTISEYRGRYFHPGAHNGYVVYEWVLNDFMDEAIQEKLSDICLSMKASDYIQLPDRLDEVMWLEMRQEVAKKYQVFEKSMVTELGEKEIAAASAGVLVGKLLQFANGALYNDETGTTYETLHEEKIEALEELLEQADEEPVLVYYWFHHDLERLLKKFPHAVVLEGSQQVKDWNDKKIRLLLAHPGSAGHGLNLQYGGSILVWFSLTWSLELYQQANARLHRQGQTKPVRIYHLAMKKTVDEDVLKALQAKTITQQGLLEAVKRRNNGTTH